MTDFRKIFISLFFVCGGIITMLRGLLVMSPLSQYQTNELVFIPILGGIMVVVGIIIRLEENGFIKIQKVKSVDE